VNADNDAGSATALSAQSGLPPATVTSFLLVVVEGPDAGKTFCLDGSNPSRTFIGQSAACEIRLVDRQVSRRHAALELTGRSLRLTDLASTNGTFANGVSVVEANLTGGELVRLGETTLRIGAGEPATLPTSSAASFRRVIGASVEMRCLYPLCERLAQSSLPLVIEGETGTGKELLAESIHEASPRSGGPFIVLDCTAIPPSMMEAELFGHERGAFTGAVATRRGLFEQADGGSLLVDEIGELDLSLQSRLLRAIERSEVRRVGGDTWIRVDVRVMAATRRDLDHEVQARRFRDDLFYRLAVARIELPPLRRREGDVTLLASHFWRTLGGGETPMPYSLLRELERHTWPGNVRELHNAVARRLALGDDVQTSALPPDDEPGPPPSPVADGVIDTVLGLDLPLAPARERVVQAFERRYVERVLARHGGNVARAAEASGVARRYFNILKARQAK
jgi:two-component system response regulator HydG